MWASFSPSPSPVSHLICDRHTHTHTHTHNTHTSYDREGSVLDPALHDIPLSYYQRSTLPSASPQTNTYSHTHLQPSTPATSGITPLLPGSSAPPPSGGQNTFPQKEPTQEVVYTDRKQQTIYDAELKLLLSPAPPTPAAVATTLGDFPVFQHGSFLLYTQRGLLETFPLTYSCYSLNSDTTVEEPLYQNLHSTSPASASSNISMDTTKTSGYFYPTSSGQSPASRASSLSYRTPQACPKELTKSGLIARELVMIVNLQSGKAYSAVLKFDRTVLLTDFSISNNPSVGCVSVEVWGEEGEGEGVKLAQSTEIQEKNLMLGNLCPPPVCQFVRVSGSDSNTQHSLSLPPSLPPSLPLPLSLSFSFSPSLSTGDIHREARTSERKGSNISRCLLWSSPPLTRPPGPRIPGPPGTGAALSVPFSQTGVSDVSGERSTTTSGPGWCSEGRPGESEREVPGMFRGSDEASQTQASHEDNGGSPCHDWRGVQSGGSCISH